MTLKTRRILYSFFVILFLVIAPPLVLYTAGYRYDFEYKRLVETGSLVVRSDPEDALIFLNGELLEERTPTIINTILPGKINLLIEKEGYLPWEKEIEIYPHTAAFEEDIKLYPKTGPKSIVREKVAEYWWNYKQNKIAYITEDKKLRLYNLLSQKDVLIANLDEKILTEFAFSPHDDQFFFGRQQGQNTEYFIVDANFLDKVISLNKIMPQNMESMQWDPHTPNTIYTLSDGSLYRIPYLLQTTRLIFKKSVKTYLIEKERILLIKKTADDEFDALWITLSDPSVIHLLPLVSASKYDEFVSTNSHRIALINNKTKQLTIVDPSIKKSAIEEAVITIQSVSQSLWSYDGKILIYTDGYGIYKRSFTTPITVIPQRSSSKLIVKYSQPIHAICWADNESRIFYTVHDTLRVVGIAQSSQTRSTILLNSSPTKIITASDAQIVSFITPDNILSALPLSIENNRRSFLFSDE